MKIYKVTSALRDLRTVAHSVMESWTETSRAPQKITFASTNFLEGKELERTPFFFFFLKPELQMVQQSKRSTLGGVNQDGLCK